MRIQFKQTEIMKNYDCVDGTKFGPNEEQELDDEKALALIQDYPDNFIIIAGSEVYETAVFEPVKAVDLPKTEPSCSFCGQIPARKKKMNGSVFYVCEDHTKKRKAPEK